MPRSRTRSRAIAALTGLAVALVVPAGAGAQAKAKLYSVSLSGSDRTELIHAITTSAPYGCTGSSTETQRFTASMRMNAKPKPIPFASYGRLEFNVVLTSLSAVATTETTGSYANDPNAFNHPNSCVFTPPPKKVARCTFAKDATRKQGAELALYPIHGKFEFYLNRTNLAIVHCEPDPSPDFTYGTLLAGEFPTKLSSGKAHALGNGRSESDSGTISTKDPAATGGETVKYALTVKRVR
jgi:hypothetical protein